MRLSFSALLLAIGIGTSGVGAQAPSRDELLARLGSYTRTFILNIANVVAEEQYHQEISPPRRTRTLTSDFLLVRYPGAEGLWLSFRDVFEVDGKSVRDQQEDRLTRLFLQPFDDAVTRARAIVSASEKYNLDPIGNLDNPLLALALVQSSYQPRFRYTVSGLVEKMGPGIRVIEFREFQRPTVLRAGISDLFTNGFVWMDERSGRVVKTELRIGPGKDPTQIVTTFAFDDDLVIDVPSEMQGSYPGQREEIRTTATYRRFRRF